MIFKKFNFTPEHYNARKDLVSTSLFSGVLQRNTQWINTTFYKERTSLEVKTYFLQGPVGLITRYKLELVEVLYRLRASDQPYEAKAHLNYACPYFG